LEHVDGLGELPTAPRAAAEFAQDEPGFELGVGAFAAGPPGPICHFGRTPRSGSASWRVFSGSARNGSGIYLIGRAAP
jgi:hypothetical protein